ncbi:hypothetical protein D3C72_770200 [compost metagenome]
MWGFELRHCHLQFGQCAEGVTQAGEVARAGIAQADPRKNPLDVADFLELRLQSFEAITVEQAGDRALACQQHRQVAQWAIQPAGQQAAAHGGLATVHHRLQGVVAAPGQVGVELQVTTAGAIEHHGVVQALMTQAAQMRQGGALGFFGVGQQATGGADGQGQVFAAKALEILGRELLAQAFERRIALEIPRRTATYAAAFFRRQVLGPVIRDQ